MAELWDIEIAFYTDEHGMSALDARTFTICRWMWLGDLRPLADVIEKGGPLDPPLINMLVEFIHEDRLRVAKRGRGRPKKPDRFARNLVVARAYEAAGGKSDKVFDYLAKAIGKSDRTVRQAVTAWRNRAK
jgi:hypothetical protein